MDIVGPIIDLPTRVTPELWAQIQTQRNLDIFPVVPLHIIKIALQSFTTHLVSAAMGRQRERVQGWLRDWNFCEHTGVQPDHIHFCDGPLLKGMICDSFDEPPHIAVDDNPEALHSLLGVVPIRIFFDRGEREAQPPDTLRVTSWKELNDVLRTL